MSFTAVFLKPNVLAWIPAIIYFCAGWPQVFTNHKIKSARAVSYRMLFMALSGHVGRLLYIFFLDLPLPFKIMRPMTTGVLTILIFQGYLYSTSKAIKRNVLLGYGAMAVLFLIGVYFGQSMPYQVGHAGGWIATIMLALYQVPQVLKNYRRRSVKGLSFAYLSMLCIGAVFELSNAILFGLPVQSKINGIRGIIYYVIFCYQFLAYGDAKEKSTEVNEYGK